MFGSDRALDRAWAGKDIAPCYTCCCCTARSIHDHQVFGLLSVVNSGQRVLSTTSVGSDDSILLSVIGSPNDQRMAAGRESSHSKVGQIATPMIMVDADPDIETGSAFHPTDEFEDGGGGWAFGALPNQS